MAGVIQYTLIQSLFDLVFLILVLFSFFSQVFHYMSDYSIGISFLSYSFKTNESLDAYVRANYQDFEEYFCVRQTNLPRLKLLCENFDSFKSSSLIFLVLSSLSLSLMLYSQCFLIGRVFKTKRPFFQFVHGHLIYPLVYLTAVASYLGTSQVFSLKVDGIDCRGLNCEVLFSTGFYLMIASALTGVFSLLWFFWTRSKINNILSPPDITK
jgi:hypothetical protein